MMHPSLTNPPGDLIDGAWRAAAAGDLISRNPARPTSIVWHGCSSLAHVSDAVSAASAALPRWSRMPIERREGVLRRFSALATERAPALAALISDEVGKVRWEARQEAALLPAKAETTLDASLHSGRARVTPYTLTLGPSREGRCLFRPHGVFAVVGPFNFPLHLPAGHILPALLTGNTIVFKPSDKAPACGQALVELLDRALRDELGDDASAGIVNLVQGGAEIAAALVAHDGLDGIAFTGSWPVGRRILQANLDRPGRIIALELGGNSAAIVMPDADLRQAAIEIARSAFTTSGQRCTCTRRAIIHAGVADRLIPALARTASTLIVGDPRATHPVFMGPLISAGARDDVLRFQQAAAADPSARVLVPCTPVEVAGCEGGHFLSAGLIRVERFSAAGVSPAADDGEIFGPLLRVSVADTLDDALAQANATRFGLAASIFTRDESAIDRFLREARAGCLNINTGTAGASGKLPFGGLGLSGNHRPAGAFALDYCAAPVAAMIERGRDAALPEGMRIDESLSNP